MKLNLKLKLLLTTALLVVGVFVLHAQTQQYNSLSVQGSPGEPRATFTFAKNVEVTVQCDYSRGIIVTNAGVYGTEAIGFFPLSCTSTQPFTVQNVPLGPTTVQMTYENGPDYGDPAGTFTLTLDSAKFTESLGRYHPSTGSATITY